MRYTVRTPEGELTYQSFGEVEQAYLNGLIDPEDELLEEGTTRWRKAGSVPLLAQARRRGNQVWGGTQSAWMIIAVVFGGTALYMIAHGKLLIGFVLAVVLGVFLTQATMRAHKRTNPMKDKS